MALKVRQHNEWFRPIERPKHCPSCGQKAQVWTWGEYVVGKWRNVKHFCQHCFPDTVRGPLLAHAGSCGCTINLKPYHCVLPNWLTLAGDQNETHMEGQRNILESTEGRANLHN